MSQEIKVNMPSGWEKPRRRKGDLRAFHAVVDFRRRPCMNAPTHGTCCGPNLGDRAPLASLLRRSCDVGTVESNSRTDLNDRPTSTTLILAPRVRLSAIGPP